MRHLLMTVPCLWGLLGLAACAGPGTGLTGAYVEYDRHLQAGEFDRALKAVHSNRADGVYRDEDIFLANYDTGMLHLYRGDADSAVTYLRRAEDFAEANYATCLADLASGMLTNEASMTYGGEDYEVLYTTVMKSLVFAVEGRFTEAMTESRRTDIMRRMLRNAHLNFQEQYEKDLAVKADSVVSKGSTDLEEFPFVESVFGHYLSAHLYRTRGQFEDMRIDRERIPPRLVRDSEENPDEGPVALDTDEPIVSIVGLFGAPPSKETITYRIKTWPDQDIAHVLRVGSRGSDAALATLPWPFDLDVYAKFEVPTLHTDEPLVSGAELRVDGRSVGQLSRLENVGEIGRRAFEAKKKAIYLRTLVRASAKAVGLAIGAEELKKKTENSLLGSLIEIGAAAALEFTERADVRSTRFLPGEVWVLDQPLKPGTYDLEVVLQGSGGRVVGRDTFNGVVVEDSKPWTVLPVVDLRKEGWTDAKQSELMADVGELD